MTDEHEIYCSECGSCGEPGCCSVIKCKYFANYLEDYKWLNEECERLTIKTKKLEEILKHNNIYYEI